MSIPVIKGEGEGEVEARVVMWKRREEGTIRIEVFPLTLLMNDLLQYDVFIKRKNNSSDNGGDDMYLLSCSDSLPLSVNEVIQ